MSDAPKKLVIGSMIAATLVALLAICDLIFKFPFSGTAEGAEHVRMMDILFIVAAGIIGYLAWDSYKDLR
jgi:hypothetical protein